MRVIAGIAKGRKLASPKGNATRPMMERAREGLFSSLGNALAGAKVLDLYAGSGSLGIEALSRGAQRAVFVERQAAALETLRSNIETAGLGGEIVDRSVEDYLASNGDPFDLVFVDPPYADDATSVGKVLDSLAGFVTESGIVLLHRRKGSPPIAPPKWLALSATLDYGDTELFRFERSQ